MSYPAGPANGREQLPDTDPAADTGPITQPIPRVVTGLRGEWKRLAAFAALAAGLGAASGVLWWALVRLPSYSVGESGRAGISERGLTEFFAGDAWFCLIGFVLGLFLGIAGWRLFRDVGWPVAVVVVVLAAVAGLICWRVGYAMGPGPFVPRLAAAQPGGLVPIELTVRSPVALVVWPFAAILPILLASSLGRDDETPRPLFRRRSTGTEVDPHGR